MEEQTSQLSPTLTVNKTVKGPKALFWYLTMFFSLALTAFATGGVWFQYVNKWFPQEVASGYVRTAFNPSALKFNMASLLIAAPLFFLFSYLVRKALKKQTLSPHSKIRTWFTYIILFLTIAIALGDLITTVFRLLDGDFTPRFILKSLTILIIVGGIFIYYGMELKSPNGLTDSKLPLVLAAAAGVIMLISFISAFFIIESPMQSRLRSFDNRRASDLQEIKYNINNYYWEKNSLPASLEDLKNNYQRGISIVDPKTNQPYEYQTTGERSFQLCAVFETSNKEIPIDYPQEYYSDATYEVGRNCFDYNISEKDLGEPVKNMVVPVD